MRFVGGGDKAPKYRYSYILRRHMPYKVLKPWILLDISIILKLFLNIKIERPFHANNRFFQFLIVAIYALFY